MNGIDQCEIKTDPDFSRSTPELILAALRSCMAGRSAFGKAVDNGVSNKGDIRIRLRKDSMTASRT